MTQLLLAFYNELVARGQLPPFKGGPPKCLDGWGGAAEEQPTTQEPAAE